MHMKGENTNTSQGGAWSCALFFFRLKSKAVFKVTDLKDNKGGFKDIYEKGLQYKKWTIRAGVDRRMIFQT